MECHTLDIRKHAQNFNYKKLFSSTIPSNRPYSFSSEDLLDNSEIVKYVYTPMSIDNLLM